ncbi:MAG: GNAT family N-acetyltransferase [Cycloclasticus sp.]|nr:GNAT family N-acetyltransferase [Cycloclasticus sp.]
MSQIYSDVGEYSFFKGSDNMQLLNEIGGFRIRVWAEKLTLAKATERFGLIEDDLKTIHCVKFDGNKIIAAAGLTIANNSREITDLCSYASYVQQMCYPMAIINRRVVDKKYRKQNIGRQLVLARIQKAKQLKIKEVWAEILVENKHFLIQQGFKDMGKSADKSIDGDWRILVKKLDE